MSRSSFTSQKQATTKHTVTHLECFLENIGRLRPVGIRQLVRPVVVRVFAVGVAVRALAPGVGKEELCDGSHFWPMGWGEISMGRAPATGLQSSAPSARVAHLNSVPSAFAPGGRTEVIWASISIRTCLLRTGAQIALVHGTKSRRDRNTGHPQRPVIQPPRVDIYICEEAWERAFPPDNSENPGRPLLGGRAGVGLCGGRSHKHIGISLRPQSGSCHPTVTYQGDLFRMCVFAFRTRCDLQRPRGFNRLRIKLRQSAKAVAQLSLASLGILVHSF